MAAINEFVIPTNKQIGAKLVDKNQDDEPCIYLCGNSLGLLPKRSAALVQEELNVWGSRAVEGHFAPHPHGREWTLFADHLTPLLADLVGAKEKEVACMSTLTANLHLMMNTFYNPTPQRFKILCEARAFPSDQYAFESQVLLHGLDPKTTIIEISPREGEFTLREEDISETIAREGSSIALVLFSGVQYYTGQWFPMQSITKKAKEQGCICGWDLAHGIGNVPLSLHDWDVDFAVWCTYKYLNSGPGGIAGLFMHEKWDESIQPKFAGWWGNELSTRFKMSSTFSPVRGAQGFQQSNPSILAMASLLGSLQVFKQAGMMPALRSRSLMLTACLEGKLQQSKYFIPSHEVAATYPPSAKLAFTIITPADPESRGAQLSMIVLPPGSGMMIKVFDKLAGFGVVGDKREPDVIRLSPIPLYNSTKDCEMAVHYWEKAFDSLAGKE